MKKGLLLVSVILASQASFGQLTPGNEPAIGASSTMYVVDATGIDASGTVGTNVEWDYRNSVMELSNTAIISVEDATTTSNASSFSSSTKAITQGVILQYLNSTASERVSQGFVFNEPTFGEVVVTFEIDEAVQLTYPFNYGDNSSDSYAGSTVLNVGIPTTASVTGNVHTTIDGTGTLQLPTEDVTDVFRLTTIDTTVVDAGFIGVEVVRTQYEYYKLSEQDLPVFVDINIFISGIGEQRQVLSKYFSTVGLEKNAIENVVLYPNPSAGEFTISGDFTKGAVEVTDLSGRVVYSSEITSGNTVKLGDVKSGIYTVKLSANDKISVQKITIK